MQDNARERLRRKLGSAGVTLGMACPTLLALEVVLRICDFKELRQDSTERSLGYRYDAELGWAPVPNSTSSVTNSRTIQVRHNSLGLRDEEFVGDGKPVIVFLGDSFVWGLDSEEGERFSDLRLAQANDVGAEVLVTACPYCIGHFEESRLSAGNGASPVVMDLAEVVLAALLEEDHLAGVLAVLQQATVLDLAVEPAEPAQARPPPVAAPDEAFAVEDLELEDGSGQVLDPEEPESAGLAHGLRLGGRHSDRDVQVGDPGPVGHHVELVADVADGAEAAVQGGVEQDQGALPVGGGAGLQHAALGSQDAHPVDRADLAVEHQALVVHDARLDPPGSTVETRHVHVVEVDAPDVDAVGQTAGDVAERDVVTEGVEHGAAPDDVPLVRGGGGPGVREGVVAPTDPEPSPCPRLPGDGSVVVARLPGMCPREEAELVADRAQRVVHPSMVRSTATLRDEPYGALWTTTTVRVLWTVSGARTASALTAEPAGTRDSGAQPSLRNHTVASGGTTMSAYAGWPWWSPSTAVIEPRLPTPEPW